jgi:hypothetical protein
LAVGETEVAVIRNFDGEQGRELAASLEGVYGLDVLTGRGTKNKCSRALYDPVRAEADLGTGDTCVHFNDGFVKLWPILGEGHGGNYDGDLDRASVLREVVDAAGVKAGRQPLSADAKGSAQVLRFRSPGCQIPPKKVGPKGDHMHAHVDSDPAVERVTLMSIGDTVRIALDHGAGCRRLAACNAQMTKAATKEGKDEWMSAACPTCQEVELGSGDVLIFDGRPSAQVVHGILDTLPGTGPAGLPAWATGCRVSVQYRLFGEGQAGGVRVSPWQGAGAGAGAGWVLRDERKHDGLHVKLFHDFLTPDNCTSLINCLGNYIADNDIYFGKFPNKDPQSESASQFQCGLAFGDASLRSYPLRIGKKHTTRPLQSWEDGQLGIMIRDIGRLINQRLGARAFDYCVVQKYDETRHFMVRHRDNEQDPDTAIFGLSVGATYHLTMRRAPNHKEKFDLPNGSLYVLEPPTNETWTHEISRFRPPHDPTGMGPCGTRFSLTFRRLDRSLDHSDSDSGGYV